MLQSPPATPGMREEEIDTPALLIDLDAFEANLDRMAALLAPTKAKLRAHAKTHKSPVIAHLQMRRGAVGQCVQKVAEAEALAWGGVTDILVSNEVVGRDKLARLAALARLGSVRTRARTAGWPGLVWLLHEPSPVAAHGNAVHQVRLADRDGAI